MAIKLRDLSRAWARASTRGCVPHLPAPGCWPDRSFQDIRQCFPPTGKSTTPEQGTKAHVSRRLHRALRPWENV